MSDVLDLMLTGYDSLNDLEDAINDIGWMIVSKSAREIVIEDVETIAPPEPVTLIIEKVNGLVVITDVR